MKNKNLANQILNKIKKREIKPKPRWEFLLKDSVIWLLVIFALIIGSFATSVIIYMFDNNQWDLYKEITDSFFAFVFVTLPYFWLIILGIFVYFIYYNFRHTKGGYKYRAYSVIITSIFISIVLGFIFYNMGLAHAIDRVFEQKAPLYRQVINNRKIIFTKPERGILPGRVIKIISPEEFKLIDLHSREWQIIKHEMIIGLPVKEGQSLILLGEKVTDDIFIAENIRPFMEKCSGWLPQKIKQPFFDCPR